MYDLSVTAICLAKLYCTSKEGREQTFFYFNAVSDTI